MIHDIYLSIYRMPYSVLAISTVAFLVLVSIVSAFLSKRAKVILGSIAAAVILLIILYITLFGRSEPETGLVLKPGYSIRRAFISDEYLRMVLMNIFVFIPFGAFLSMAISPSGMKMTVLVTICSGLVLTVIIEALQYMLNLGCAETDDIICNVVGTCLGLLPYLLTFRAADKRN